MKSETFKDAVDYIESLELPVQYMRKENSINIEIWVKSGSIEKIFIINKVDNNGF